MPKESLIRISPRRQYYSPDFVTIARVAMALEKTQGWEAPARKQVRQLLAPNPDATRYLDIMHMLVTGKTRGHNQPATLS